MILGGERELKSETRETAGKLGAVGLLRKLSAPKEVNKTVKTTSSPHQRNPLIGSGVTVQVQPTGRSFRSWLEVCTPSLPGFSVPFR